MKRDNPLEKNPSDTGQGKRPYQTPSLQSFGRVGSLTKSSICSTANDGQSIAVCNPGNMAMAVSDPGLKENILKIGDHPLGIGLYLFDYVPEYKDRCGHGRQFGVMADEVAKVMPEAVGVHADGYQMVNYGMLGITRPFH